MLTFKRNHGRVGSPLYIIRAELRSIIALIHSIEYAVLTMTSLPVYSKTTGNNSTSRSSHYQPTIVERIY